jgi:hypothetical protein
MWMTLVNRLGFVIQRALGPSHTLARFCDAHLQEKRGIAGDSWMVVSSPFEPVFKAMCVLNDAGIRPLLPIIEHTRTLFLCARWLLTLYF